MDLSKSRNQLFRLAQYVHMLHSECTICLLRNVAYVHMFLFNIRNVAYLSGMIPALASAVPK